MEVNERDIRLFVTGGLKVLFLVLPPLLLLLSSLEPSSSIRYCFDAKPECFFQNLSSGGGMRKGIANIKQAVMIGIAPATKKATEYDSVISYKKPMEK